MRNKRVVNMIRKLLTEKEEMSTDGIHQQLLGKSYCPSKQHLGVILTSLTFVTSDKTFTDEHGSVRNLWRLRDEAPTDN